METNDTLEVGKLYPLQDIWRVFDVPESDRTNDWLSGHHEHDGDYFVLCTGNTPRMNPPGYQCRLRWGRLSWYGEIGANLPLFIGKALIEYKGRAYVFLRETKDKPFRYEGRGAFCGYDEGRSPDPPTIDWDIDCGSNLARLPVHIDRLSKLMAYELEPCFGETSRKGRNLMCAIDWLAVAGAIYHVEVDTMAFAEGVMYCGNVRDYEAARSVLLSDLVTELTVFNFAWSALEIIIDLMNLPEVPRTFKKGKTGFVDQALWFLKNNYQPVALDVPLICYDEVLGDLRSTIGKMARFSHLGNRFTIQDHMCVSGIGLYVINKLRNSFAHGKVDLPEPKDWSWDATLDVKLIELSTRIILLSLQMLLSTYFREDDWAIDIGAPDDGRTESVHVVLRSLHLRASNLHSL